MSKSLKALEELKDEIIPDYALEYENDEGYKDWVIELYNIIKQDLESKKQLEKRNKELVNIIDELREENFKIKQIQTCIWGEQDTVRQEQIETLIKENQKLLMALENKNKEIGNLKKLIHDNPYKKAIEDKIEYLEKGVFLASYDYIKGGIQALKDLLKEVLK